MTEELKPCPFCGASASGYAIEPHSHAIVVDGFRMPDHAGSYVIEGDCPCGSGLIGETQEEVTARWNTRATPAPAQPEGQQDEPVAQWQTRLNPEHAWENIDAGDVEFCQVKRGYQVRALYLHPSRSAGAAVKWAEKVRFNDAETPDDPPFPFGDGSAGAAAPVEGAAWQMVPAKATKEMMAAAWNHTPLDMSDMTDGDFGQAYADMLAAAPKEKP